MYLHWRIISCACETWYLHQGSSEHPHSLILERWSIFVFAGTNLPPPTWLKNLSANYGLAIIPWFLQFSSAPPGGWEIFLESQQPNTLIGFHYAGCWLEHYTVEANVTMCVLCRLPKQKEEVHQRDLLSGAVIRISQVTDSHQASHCIETCQASSFTGLSFSRHSKGEKGWRLFYSQNRGSLGIPRCIYSLYFTVSVHIQKGGMNRGAFSMKTKLIFRILYETHQHHIWRHT